MQSLYDVSPDRLTKIFDALKQHEASLFVAQKQNRTRRESLVRWSQAITLTASGLYVAFAVALRWFPEYLPTAVLAQAALILISILTVMLLGMVSSLGAVLAQFWRYTSRPMLNMLPRLSAWTQLEHGLAQRLVAIGGIQELTTAERSLAEEAEAMEHRRKIWVAGVGVATVGGGLLTALKGESGLTTSAIAAGFVMLSNLSASIYCSQLRRYASVMLQAKTAIEKGQAQLVVPRET